MAYQYSPQVTPASLVQLGNVPVQNTLDGLQWLNRGQAADEGGLATLMASQQHEQNMFPMLQRQQALQNQTSEATLPGIVAQSSMLRRKDRGEETTFDDDIKGKLQKFAVEASDNDLKLFDNNVQKMLYANPNDPKALKLFAASKHMMEVRQKHLDDMEKQAALFRQQTALEEMKIKGRQTAAEFKAKHAGSSPAKLEAVQTELSRALMAEEDPEKRAIIADNLRFILQQRQALLPPPVLQPTPAATAGRLEPTPRPPMPALPGAPAGGGGQKADPLGIR